jgi:hypothetical protein
MHGQQNFENNQQIKYIPGIHLFIPKNKKAGPIIDPAFF